MQLLTVFTPTYNRKELLARCYESMKRQTNKDFVWMVIDDGSIDGTDEIVKSWLHKENGFELKYYYKENGGLHTAYNEAIARIETPLCVCIDSDDFMPDDAVERIISFWEKNGSDEYAGIVGLDYYLNGNVIGECLPEQKTINLIDLLIGKYSIVNGDRTNVIRTELYKQVAPMCSFGGEKYFNPHYMHLLISKNYDFLVLNENLRFVEYQPGGLSDSIMKQYKNNPNGFIETRRLYLSFDNASIKFKCKHAIHLVSSCILARRFKEVIKISPRKGITMLMIPFGILLALYITIVTK